MLLTKLDKTSVLQHKLGPAMQSLANYRTERLLEAELNCFNLKRAVTLSEASMLLQQNVVQVVSSDNTWGPEMSVKMQGHGLTTRHCMTIHT